MRRRNDKCQITPRAVSLNGLVTLEGCVASAPSQLVASDGLVPTSIVTDRYRVYDAALRDLGLSSIHRRGKRLNNRAESSHVPIRRRERKMQGFRSAGSAQRFPSSASYNTFNVGRHLITANTHRILRSEAFDIWKAAVTA